MDPNMVGILVGAVLGVLSFALARWLSRGWRARRAERQRQAAVAAQSRQVRRAEERRGKKKG